MSIRFRFDWVDAAPSPDAAERLELPLSVDSAERDADAAGGLGGERAAGIADQAGSEQADWGDGAGSGRD